MSAGEPVWRSAGQPRLPAGQPPSPSPPPLPGPRPLPRSALYIFRHFVNSSVIEILVKTKSLRTFSGSFTATITFLQLLFLYALTWKINLDPWLISKRKFENGFNFIYCYRKFSVTVPLKYKLSVFKNL